MTRGLRPLRQRENIGILIICKLSSAGSLAGEHARHPSASLRVLKKHSMDPDPQANQNFGQMGAWPHLAAQTWEAIYAGGFVALYGAAKDIAEVVFEANRPKAWIPPSDWKIWPGDELGGETPPPPPKNHSPHGSSMARRANGAMRGRRVGRMRRPARYKRRSYRRKTTFGRKRPYYGRRRGYRRTYRRRWY